MTDSTVTLTRGDKTVRVSLDDLEVDIQDIQIVQIDAGERRFAMLSAYCPGRVPGPQP